MGGEGGRVMCGGRGWEGDVWGQRVGVMLGAEGGRVMCGGRGWKGDVWGQRVGG